jgi:hypothetical protein
VLDLDEQLGVRQSNLIADRRSEHFDVLTAID